MNIGILGAGSWGTAIAILRANNGHDITLWSAVEAEVKELTEKRALPSRLPGAHLQDNIKVTGELKEACESKDLIVFAVASPFVRKTANLAAPLLDRNTPVVNVAKGIEEGSLMTLTEIIEDEFKKDNGNAGNVSVLSGPSHAEEVSLGVPTTCVVGSKDKDTACLIQDAFMTEVFRVYTSPDITGIEIGGSLKNVIALAAGICDGLGYGDNTKAALMTRGINEISRLGIAMGGKMETFAGLSGIGDLIVTCTSHHSRNWNAGNLIGKGYTADQAMREVGQVVEGVFCAKAALELAKKFDVDMPIVEQMNDILFNNKMAKTAVSELFCRDKRVENSHLKW